MTTSATLIRTARDAGIDFFDHADGVRQRDARVRAAVRRGAAPEPERAGRDHHPDQGGHRPGGPVLRLLLRASDRARPRSRCGRCRPTTSTSSCCTARTPWSNPTRLPAPSTNSRASGKVRAFGVSNHTPRQIDLLKTAVRATARGQPAAAVDHPRADHRPGRGEQHGRAEQSVTLDGGGIVDYCRVNRHHRAGLVALPGRILHRRVPRTRPTTPN